MKEKLCPVPVRLLAFNASKAWTRSLEQLADTPASTALQRVLASEAQLALGNVVAAQGLLVDLGPLEELAFVEGLRQQAIELEFQIRNFDQQGYSPDPAKLASIRRYEEALDLLVKKTLSTPKRRVLFADIHFRKGLFPQALKISRDILDTELNLDARTRNKLDRIIQVCEGRGSLEKEELDFGYWYSKHPIISEISALNNTNTNGSLFVQAAAVIFCEIQSASGILSLATPNGYISRERIKAIFDCEFASSVALELLLSATPDRTSKESSELCYALIETGNYRMTPNVF